MDAMDVAQRYFNAWNRRDASELIATFADSGTYCDPATSQPLTEQAIAAYASGRWAAFPDLLLSDNVTCR
jgi:ketosteroid isomerase-like protein